MPMTLTPDALDGVLSRLREANLSFAARFPGDAGTRQAVHTVYGGAQIFKSDTAKKLGTIALNLLQEYAPDYVTFARAIGLPGNEHLPPPGPQAAGLKRRFDEDPEELKAT